MKHGTFTNLRSWFAVSATAACASLLTGCLFEEGNTTNLLDLTDEQIAQIRAIAQDEALNASEVAGIAGQVFDNEVQNGLVLPEGPEGPAGPTGPQGPTGPAGTTSWNGLVDIPSAFADNEDNVLMPGAGLTVDGDVLTIDNGAITSAMLADGSVTITKIADGSVASVKIVNGAITSEKLAAGSVTADKIAVGAVSGDALGMGSITAMQLADGAVTTTKLADGSVASVKIINGSITEAKLADGAVTADKLALGAVDAGSLSDGAITADKLADGSVTTAKILDGSITSLKLAPGSVTNSKLAAEAVSNAKIGNQAVSTLKIQPGAITTDRLADGAVTTAKLAVDAIDSTVIPDNLALGSQASEPGTLTVFNAGGTATVFVNGDGGDRGELVLSDAAGLPMIMAIAKESGSDEARLIVQGEVDACAGNFNGCDIAEVFELNNRAAVRPGNVMIIDPQNPGSLTLSSTPYDKRVAGVISGAGTEYPGVCLGQRHDGSRDLPVALSGRVYVKVDATAAAIEVGDLLTTSARAGYAMKASDPAQAFGAVLGKAMQPLAKGEIGEILVLVALQ